MKMASSSPLRIAYWLGTNRLYLQVTSRRPSGCITLFQARGPGFKLPNGFAEINHEPEAEELADCVEYAYEHDERKLTAAKIGMGENDEGVVFAGTGEPLLRLDTVLRASELIKERRHGVPLRLSTTTLGIEDPEGKVPQQLAEAGIDTVSIFLPSADPKKYQSLMNASLSVPCNFMSLCADAELKLRVVTVAAPGVDVDQVRKLASSLGAVEIEVKSYVP